MERAQETEEFHDGESDVYDLFNACNGVLGTDGLLDVKQLNRYSPDAAEELNVSRLRVVWEHTATGCPRCAQIIKSLQALRKALRERSARQRATADINDTDSIS